MDESWTWVCEGALNQLGAEVVCRELGCGAPGEGQVLLGPVFQCEGHESTLKDCPRFSSDICSSETSVILTCSEPIRLVGDASRCAGVVEARHKGWWHPILITKEWDLLQMVCRDLHCGSAVSGKVIERRKVIWDVSHDCVKKAPISDCLRSATNIGSRTVQEAVCSELLNRPNISVSVSADGALEAEAQGVRVLLGSDFSVICSVEPQYPGGIFQLISNTPNPENLTLPAVNHTAHFLFSDAGPAHRGGYTCVYHLHVFNHNFSSQSLTLQLSLGASDFQLIIRVLILVLLKLIYIPALCCYYKATRGHAR
ncbi:hypothetical protein NL108_015358 [Boleophthalmus pectinirostris]|nr:hypothetical protein NL108_015358 [Boleophthalmus pectinirostris]